jgi:hypothetical protein
LYGWNFEVIVIESSVRPWNAPSKATTPGRPVCSRASFTAFSTASVPALKNAARVSPEIGASAHRPLGQLDGGRIRDDREVGVEEARRLLGDRLDDPRMRVTRVDHAHAAREVDEDVAVDVGDRRVLARSAKIGRWTSSGCAITAPRAPRSRESVARDLGPISIVLVAAISSSVSEASDSRFAPWTHGWRPRRRPARRRSPPGSTRRAPRAPRAEAQRWRPRTPTDGRAARMVLVRGIEERDLRFYTNHESRKADEIAENPRAALVFHWAPPLHRQARVEGSVTRLTDDESLVYFRTRARESRLGAWASPQSRPLADREELDRLLDEVERRFAATEDVPLPPFWGGLPPHARGDRAVAEPAGPVARPRALRAGRRGLVAHQAGALRSGLRRDGSGRRREGLLRVQARGVPEQVALGPLEPRRPDLL